MSETDSPSIAGYLRMANELLSQLGISRHLTSIEEIGANIFVPLYEGICNEDLPELILPCRTPADERHNLQSVIDSLANDILHVSLSHIRAEDIISGDRIAICNLLEIFQGLMEYLLHRAQEPEEVPQRDSEVVPVEDRRRLVEDADMSKQKDKPNSFTHHLYHHFSPAQKDAQLPPRMFKSHSDTDLSPTGLKPEHSYRNLEKLVQKTLRMSQEALEEKVPVKDATTSPIKPVSYTSSVDHMILKKHIDRVAEEALEIGKLAEKMADDRHRADGFGDRRAKGYLYPTREDDDDESSEEEYQEREPPHRLFDYVADHQDRISDLKPPPNRKVHFNDRSNYALRDASTLTEALNYNQDVLDARRDLLHRAYERSIDEVAEKNDAEMQVARKSANKQQQKFRALTSKFNKRPTSGVIIGKARACGVKKPEDPWKNGISKSDANNEVKDILPALLEEFPFLHLSPETVSEMWHRAEKQAKLLSNARLDQHRIRKGKAAKEVAEAERRQRILTDILRKELEHNQRLREQHEREAAQKSAKVIDRERRSQSAKSKQYYDEFVTRQRARMLAKRSLEEQVFRKLFKDALTLQKERLHDLRSYAKDHQTEQYRKTADEVASMENFYRDRFAMLAESLAREREELAVREKAHDRVVRGLSRDMRRSLETDVRQMQDQLARDQDDAHYRQLDADAVLSGLYSKIGHPAAPRFRSS